MDADSGRGELLDAACQLAGRVVEEVEEEPTRVA
jgi:hypothetical protein